MEFIIQKSVKNMKNCCNFETLTILTSFITTDKMVVETWL